MRFGIVRRISLLLLLLTAGTWLFSSSLPKSGPARPGLLSPDGTAPPNKPTAVLSDVTIYAPVKPVAGSVADRPTDNSIGSSKYERWLRGELGQRKEFRVSPNERTALQALAMQLSPSVSITQLSNNSSLASPALGITFDSLDVNGCCASGATVPPDPELSAGPNHLIAVVNVAFEIYDKVGNSLSGPVTFSSFFSPLGGSNCTAGGPFDPNTLYDEASDRFLVAVDGNGQAYCVAVSQTSDPMGSWWLYEFPTGTPGTFFDYPHAAVGRDAIYMGANMFVNQSFAEGRIWALDKSAMYAGNEAGAVSRSTGSNSTPQPVNLHGYHRGTWPESGPHYIITDGPQFDGQIYTLYTWEDPFGADTFSLAANLDFPAAHEVEIGFPLASVQAGGSAAGDIQSNDPRVLDFEYRNGSGWTTMTVACNPGGGTVNCIQWAEIDLAGAQLVQAGVLASPGDYRYFPDIAANHCGDAALGYTKSSASLFPSVWATGRRNDDPSGTMQVELEVKGGEVTYTAFDIDSPPLGQMRWGDYSGMTIDPNGLTFWYVGQYSKDVANGGANWGNAIGALTYPDCVTEPDFRMDATPSRQTICVPDEATYAIEVNPLGAFNDPVTLSTAGGVLGYSANFSINPVIPPGSSILTLTQTAQSAPGSYALNLQGISPTRTHTLTLGLELLDAVPQLPQLLLPEDGTTGTSLTPSFSWIEAAGATSYAIEVASDLQFTNLVFSTTTTNTVFTPTIELDPNSSFYWRVRANNACGDSPASPPRIFSTANYLCRSPAVNIPDNDPEGISDSLEISQKGEVIDLDVHLDTSHTWVGDLTFTLTHKLTSVALIERPGVSETGSFFGCASDDIRALIDDEGTDGSVETTCDEGPALTGSLTPEPGQLAAFDQASLAGTWTLTVSDSAGSDTGRLNRWCLVPTTIPEEQTILYLPLISNTSTKAGE